MRSPGSNTCLRRSNRGDPVAIPYENELVRKARDEIESVGGRIASLENYREVLRQ